jgi:hypothetical protein
MTDHWEHLAHKSAPIVIWICTSGAVFAWAPDPIRGLGNLIGFLLIGPFIVMFFITHAKQCIRCIKDIVDTPLEKVKDPWRYWYYHRIGDLIVLIAFLLYIFSSFILDYESFLNRLVVTVFSLIVAYTWHCMYWHVRFVNWCPYCNPGGEGGFVEEPDPDPSTYKKV